MSRSKNALKNVSISVVSQIVTLLLNFVGRTVFIYCLGNDYVSCEGLLTNVLTLLSFTELGLGSAIIQSLYKPCAQKDYEKIGQLLGLFSKAYAVIAVTISALGIAIFPFISFLRGDLAIENTEFAIIYFLFLANTVASYICGYKRSFLIADQKNYVVSLVHQGIIFLKTALQIVLLVTTGNYYLYLIVAIVTTVINNIVCNIITDRKYPQLSSYKGTKLPPEERKGIFKNIFSIFHYKIGSVILNGSDNIIISGVLKTTLVGLVSNYNIIILALQSIMNHAFSSVQATVGNHVVSEGKEKQHHVFDSLWLISYWVVGFATIELMLLSSTFVENVWLSAEYLLPFDTLLMMVLSFYVLMINSIPSTYRIALGFFNEAKWSPIAASVINIILSVVLAKFWGLTGVFFATVVSRLTTFSIVDTFLVVKKHFGKSPWMFFLKNILAFLFMVCNYIITYFATSFITVTGIYTFAAKLVLSVVCCNLLFLLVFARNKNFRSVLSYAKGILNRKKVKH